MTDAEARELFDLAIMAAEDPDEIARLELAREYFCNPAFRAALHDYSFAVTYADPQDALDLLPAD